MARKTLLVGFVTGSLFVHDIQPLSGKETLNKSLTRQTSPTTKAHVHGALLTDIARTLQTAVYIEPFLELDDVVFLNSVTPIRFMPCGSHVHVIIT